MTIYSIADLHLSNGDKPMDVFGLHWERHFERISRDWAERVRGDDIVLIPGDISWAMRLEQAVPHLQAIGALPGRKILLRGNHDYWWSAIGRVRSALPEGMYALQNDAMLLDGVLFCGTRGWLLPGEDATFEDRRIFERECIRLEMSLQRARKLSTDAPLVAMLHFPPVPATGQDTPLTCLLEQYGARQVVYGHLHGAATKNAFGGEKSGVRYQLVSCDSLDFTLWETPVN